MLSRAFSQRRRMDPPTGGGGPDLTAYSPLHFSSDRKALASHSNDEPARTTLVGLPEDFIFKRDGGIARYVSEEEITAYIISMLEKYYLYESRRDKGGLDKDHWKTFDECEAMRSVLQVRAKQNPHSVPAALRKYPLFQKYIQSIPDSFKLIPNVSPELEILSMFPEANTWKAFSRMVYPAMVKYTSIQTRAPDFENNVNTIMQNAKNLLPLILHAEKHWEEREYYAFRRKFSYAISEMNQLFSSAALCYSHVLIGIRQVFSLYNTNIADDTAELIVNAEKDVFQRIQSCTRLVNQRINIRTMIGSVKLFNQIRIDAIYGSIREDTQRFRSTPKLFDSNAEDLYSASVSSFITAARWLQRGVRELILNPPGFDIHAAADVKQSVLQNIVKHIVHVFPVINAGLYPKDFIYDVYYPLEIEGPTAKVFSFFIRYLDADSGSNLPQVLGVPITSEDNKLRIFEEDVKKMPARAVSLNNLHYFALLDPKLPIEHFVPMVLEDYNSHRRSSQQMQAFPPLDYLLSIHINSIAKLKQLLPFFIVLYGPEYDQFNSDSLRRISPESIKSTMDISPFNAQELKMFLESISSKRMESGILDHLEYIRMLRIEGSFGAPHYSYSPLPFLMDPHGHSVLETINGTFLYENMFSLSSEKIVESIFLYFHLKNIWKDISAVGGLKG